MRWADQLNKQLSQADLANTSNPIYCIIDVMTQQELEALHAGYEVTAPDGLTVVVVSSIPDFQEVFTGLFDEETTTESAKELMNGDTTLLILDQLPRKTLTNSEGATYTVAPEETTLEQIQQTNQLINGLMLRVAAFHAGYIDNLFQQQGLDITARASTLGDESHTELTEGGDSAAIVIESNITGFRVAVQKAFPENSSTTTALAIMRRKNSIFIIDRIPANLGLYYNSRLATLAHALSQSSVAESDLDLEDNYTEEMQQYLEKVRSCPLALDTLEALVSKMGLTQAIVDKYKLGDRQIPATPVFYDGYVYDANSLPSHIGSRTIKKSELIPASEFYKAMLNFQEEAVDSISVKKEIEIEDADSGMERNPLYTQLDNYVSDRDHQLAYRHPSFLNQFLSSCLYADHPRLSVKTNFFRDLARTDSFDLSILLETLARQANRDQLLGTAFSNQSNYCTAYKTLQACFDALGYTFRYETVQQILAIATTAPIPRSLPTDTDRLVGHVPGSSSTSPQFDPACSHLDGNHDQQLAQHISQSLESLDFGSYAYLVPITLEDNTVHNVHISTIRAVQAAMLRLGLTAGELSHVTLPPGCTLAAIEESLRETESATQAP